MNRKIFALTMLVVILAFSLTGCVGAEPAGEDGTAGSGGFSSYTSLIIFAVIIVVFYFFMIRPESKKKKELAKMRNEISVGDSIITIGGITGTICEVDGEFIVIESGEDRVRLRIAKWAISTKQQ